MGSMLRLRPRTAGPGVTVRIRRRTGRTREENGGEDARPCMEESSLLD